MRSVVLDQFYPDLSDPKYISNFAIYHRRFITNTMSRWPLAQPFRSLGHNGEINTLLTNINWMKAREGVLDQSVAFVEGADLSRIDPLSNSKMSDSSNLDEAITLAVRAGKTPMEALMMLVPAYKNQPELLNIPERTPCYDYHSALQDLTLAVRAGKSPSEALMMFMPEAYKNQPELLNMPEVTAFYDYHSALHDLTLAVRAGKSPSEALMMFMPKGYKNQPELLNIPERTPCYDYLSALQDLTLAVLAGKTPSEALMMFMPKGYKNQPELLNMPEVTDSTITTVPFRSRGTIPLFWCRQMTQLSTITTVSFRSRGTDPLFWCGQMVGRLALLWTVMVFVPPVSSPPLMVWFA